MTKLPKVVLDTNVLISALIFGGKPKKILINSKEKKVKAFISAPILLELAKKLDSKFSWKEERIKETVGILPKFMTVIYPAARLNLVKKDPSDNKILECAFEAKANYIVTGDKHLLEIKEFEGVKIYPSYSSLKLSCAVYDPPKSYF